MIPTSLHPDDAACLEECLEEWGGAADPAAESYRLGWTDMRRGIVDPPAREASMAEHAAYCSGSIAARETPLPASAQPVVSIG